MKKIYSLLKATMTSDMSIFKIKSKNNKKSNIKFVILLSLCFMFTIWSYANMLFEKLAPMHLEHVVLSLFVLLISVLVIIEGIYKSGPLLFNCKDDQLLFSLPIDKKVILFIRIFKFYLFELLFNALFFVPLIIAYIRWAHILNYTFYITSFIMIFILPIIPIVISCIIGYIISSISSKFKYKNVVQIIMSMALLVGVLYLSYNLEGILNYLSKHASSLNDMISKLYYPAGLYVKLVTKFNIIDLIVFIINNIVLFILLVYLLSNSYFKINSRLKGVSSNKKVNVNSLTIKSTSSTFSLVKKDLNTFFNTPVFIINAGFGLLLFIIATIFVVIRYDKVVSLLTSSKEIAFSIDLIVNKTSLLILCLIAVTAFMTSVTNSIISLEGRNINILKSLPISTKKILISKVLFGLFITTPVLFIGNIILFIKFKTSIIDSLLLLVLSILIPLVSHFIGIIVNLKYPKLNWDSTTEVVKQSTSSFIAVMIGMLLFIISIVIIINVVGNINATILLIIATLIYLVIDIILYLYLINNGVKNFNNLTT